MKKSPLSAWGRHLDDELVGVAPIVLNLGATVPVYPDLGEVWSDATPRELILSKSDMQAFAREHWNRSTRVHVWEIPGLRFDTIHGSVVVVDRYDDTEFAFLCTKAGRRALRIGTPLRHVASLIQEAADAPASEGFPDFLVAAIGWRETDALPRATPRHYCTAAALDGDYAFEWGSHQEYVSCAGVRAVGRAFRSVNGKEARAEAQLIWERARAASADVDGVDVHGGIAQLERYLDSQG